MIPPVVLYILTTMAMLTGMTLTPVTPIPPEPLPEAMTAGAVLTAPEPDLARGLYESIVGNAVIMEVKGSDLAPLELADLAKIAAFAASSNIRTRPMETEEDE